MSYAYLVLIVNVIVKRNRSGDRQETMGVDILIWSSSTSFMLGKMGRKR